MSIPAIYFQIPTFDGSFSRPLCAIPNFIRPKNFPAVPLVVFWSEFILELGPSQVASGDGVTAPCIISRNLNDKRMPCKCATREGPSGFRRVVVTGIRCCRVPEMAPHTRRKSAAQQAKFRRKIVRQTAEKFRDCGGALLLLSFHRYSRMFRLGRPYT